MPTGYTSDISKGISFKDFALCCARAFGACVMQRDDNMNEKPKKQKPSVYHEVELKKKETELEWVKNLSDCDAQKHSDDEHKKQTSEYEQAIRKNNELREKYVKMRSHIQAWLPPTPDHVGLKSFMLQQVESSIECDCDSEYFTEQLKNLKHMTGNEWKTKKTALLLWEIDYHTKQNMEEIERTESRNRWIDDLYKSLT